MNKVLLVSFLVVGVVIGYAGSTLDIGGSSDVIKPSEAKTKVEQFINQNLIPSGSDKQAEVKEVIEENGFYKVSVKLGGKSIDSYITKNGKTFFPQAINIQEKNNVNKKDTSSQIPTKKTTVETKKDTPVVELFVMSYCPYGTQMEKAILPALEALGDKVDFDMQFCDYLMHSKKELNENLRQHCVQETQPSKLNAYLRCFLGGEDVESCIGEAGVNKSAVETCKQKTDKEYNVTKNFNDKSTYKGNYPPFNVNKDANEKYGVSGSPTLIINGETIQSARTSNALLAAICSGFNKKPEVCSQNLSTSTPAPGRGSGESNGGTGNCQ